MKILIVWIAQFVGHNGGMDRVFVKFANEMARRGHKSVLVYCTEKSGKIYTPIRDDVKLINLTRYTPDHKYESIKKSAAFKVRREIFRVICPAWMERWNTEFTFHKSDAAMQKVLQEEKPDVIITMKQWTTAVVQRANQNHAIPVIAMNHFDAGTVLQWASSTELEAMKACDAIQVLMDSDKIIFQSVFPDTPIVCIPNVVPQYKWAAVQRKPMIINVARLDGIQKRQHLLIEAFSKVAEQFPDWTLELWGEEQDKNTYTKKLSEQIRAFHLENRIHLCGNTDDVLSVYRRASIFAFPSAFEGFPLAMTEAMSAGLPVVGYRSCTAVRELVEDDVTGVLVADGAEALACGLRALMSNREMREAMGQAAHEEMQKYDEKTIWTKWENLLKEVVDRHALQ